MHIVPIRLVHTPVNVAVAMLEVEGLVYVCIYNVCDIQLILSRKWLKHLQIIQRYRKFEDFARYNYNILSLN